MIRAQRRAHTRVFVILAPLLTAALIWAFVQRERTTRQLHTPATLSPSSQPEPTP